MSAKPKAGNQSLPDLGRRPAQRVRVNLSFSSYEVEVLERLALAEHVKLSTYLRQLILRSTKVKMEAGVQRRMDAQAALGYTSSGYNDRRWGILERKNREKASPFEQLAALVPRGQDGLPYYRTQEAKALLQALPASLSAAAERLIFKLKRQPTLEEYREAGIDLKAI